MKEKHPVRRLTIRRRLLPAGIAVVCLLAACAPARPATQADSGTAAPQVSQARILHILIRDEPAMLNTRLDRNGVGFPLTVPLLYSDEKGQLQGLLAEKAPSQTDGSWVINPDGTMKTTYTLKPDLKWQDGKPQTAEDFVFTWQVYTDREVPITTRTPESLMSSVVARDARTLDITWKETYIYANALSENQLAPIPKHLLEDAYKADKSTFANGAFWNSPDEFIGNGPYRVTAWDRGSSYTAVANPYFVLGKPRIDTIQFHFVRDANTAVANFLANILDFGQYTAITSEMGVTLRDRWKDSKEGRVFADTMFGVRVMEFQYRDVPGHQKAVTDVRVRRATMHAIDRTTLADELQYGFSTAADTLVQRNSPLYARVDAAISKYPYDVRRTESLLNEAGWTKGADTQFRNAAGQTLDTEIRATSENSQLALIVVDNLKRAGFNSTPFTIPAAQLNDQEVRTSFPFAGLTNNGGFGEMSDVTAEQAPTPQNRFTGKNRGSYLNPALDDLFGRYLKTVDQNPRDQLLIDMQKLYTEEVAQGTLFYLPQVAAIRTGLTGVKAPPQGSYLWNVWEWAWS